MTTLEGHKFPATRANETGLKEGGTTRGMKKKKKKEEEEASAGGRLHSSRAAGCTRQLPTDLSSGTCRSGEQCRFMPSSFLVAAFDQGKNYCRGLFPLHETTTPPPLRNLSAA